jgi:sulfate adenylyltransferase subunit 1
MAAADSPATVTKNLLADICWLSEEPLDLQRKYWIKHTTRQVMARISDIESVLDINTQQRHPANSLALNGIARVRVSVQQALAVDAYDIARASGSFILIDEMTHHTVAAGMVRLA